MPTTPGRNTAHYQRLAAQCRAEAQRRRLPCWLCRQAIDWTAPPDDPASFSVDHVQPLSTHPWLAEDPTNFRPAHRGCNTSRGNRPPPADLGTPSRNW